MRKNRSFESKQKKLRQKVMESSSRPSQIIFKSVLTPEQLKVQLIYEKCGVKIDANTFLRVWKLCELGIPPQAITELIHDIAKYDLKK